MSSQRARGAGVARSSRQDPGDSYRAKGKRLSLAALPETEATP